eukprot:CAMPEP_0197198220 /NCGR_PEP_ID=MMETSP1423-20130617/33263_1 /TAXON_ID=476441 /ORGANISM="Pseudo-nitzschia heimii, Strain UNC1101" /LENGTH=576 /DNA_ID=CAMNT_0042652051 /DNA_START=205 /DNA_END=1936 /DNA_ORIENTATION=-
MTNNFPGMAMPGGVDPRMLAFLHAQRQLQQCQSASQPSPPGGNAPRIPPQHQQQSQSQSQTPHQPQQPPSQQRQGRDADVASFLLQLKMKPNGEPVTETEAIRMVQQQQQQQQQQPQGVVPGYTHPAVPIPAGLYTYPGIVSFPRPNGNFVAAAAAAAAMGVCQPQPPPLHGYSHVGMISQPLLPPPPPPQGYIPGMTHAPAPTPLASPATGLTGGGSAPSEVSPVMTDEYIESLITNDAVAATDTAKNETDPAVSSSSSNTPELPFGVVESAKDDMNIALVVHKDRDLIPDALFVALGQMKPCRLQPSDRVGCYKTRTLGFLGMCCKHCGGQPGFGRYFPNSVRSLAQTTTSQTILKHVGGKCRYCPQNVRKALLELQRQQVHKEHLTTGRPRYGSRKIFFQRMWTRLHGPSDDGESARVVVSDVSLEQAKQEAEEAARTASSDAGSLLVTPKLALVAELPESGIVGVATTTNNAMVTTTTAATPPTTNAAPRYVKRSLLPEVSNNNTDDEGGQAVPTRLRNGVGGGVGVGGVLDISLSLDHGHNKRRKLRDEEKESSSGDNDEGKKLRIPPVAV